MIRYLKKPLSLLVPMLFPLVLVAIVFFLLPEQAEARRNKNVNRNTNVNRNVNRNTNVNVNRNVNVHVDSHHGRHGHGYYHPIATAVAVTATVAVTSAIIGSIIYSLPSGCATVIRGGIAYQQCGNTWYQPQYAGNNVNYVVIQQPY